jgi:hypothetical protein
MAPNHPFDFDIFIFAVGAIVGSIPGFFFFWPYKRDISPLTRQIRVFLVCLCSIACANAFQAIARVLQHG